MRVQRNAVSADAGAWRKLHVAKRLRRGSIDHIPHVHVEFVTHNGDFVYETDVYGAKRVLQQLDEFGGFG